jgi:hypothetical protein
MRPLFDRRIITDRFAREGCFPQFGFHRRTSVIFQSDLPNMMCQAQDQPG